MFYVKYIGKILVSETPIAAVSLCNVNYVMNYQYFDPTDSFKIATLNIASIFERATSY